MRNQLEAIYRATFNPFHSGQSNGRPLRTPAGNISYAGRVFFNRSCFSVRNERETVRISLSSPQPLTARRLSLKNPIDSARIVCGNYLELVNTVGVWGFPFVVDWKRAREFFKTERKRGRIENRYLLF